MSYRVEGTWEYIQEMPNGQRQWATANLDSDGDACLDIWSLTKSLMGKLLGKNPETQGNWRIITLLLLKKFISMFIIGILICERNLRNIYAPRRQNCYHNRLVTMFCPKFDLFEFFSKLAH